MKDDNKTVEELTELEKRNVDAALDILEELWDDIKVNNIHMEIRNIPNGFKEHSEFIRSVIQYKERASSLNSTNIFIK